AWVKARIETAIRIQPRNPAAVCAVDDAEISPHEHFAIGLECQRPDGGIGACAWIEAGIEAAVAVKPRDMVAHHSIDGVELASEQNLCVALDQHYFNFPISARSGIECGIQSAVTVQPGQVISRCAVKRAEMASDQHFGIGMDSD